MNDSAAGSSGDFQLSAVSMIDLNTRVLYGRWSAALANGDKMFEVQRYARLYRNQTKSLKPGGWLAVGEQGGQYVTCFAIIHKVVRKVSPAQIQSLTELLTPDLRVPFDDYVQKGAIFDVLLFKKVVDVRCQKMSWSSLEIKLNATASRNTGFPKIGPLTWHAEVEFNEILQVPLSICRIKDNWPENFLETEVVPLTTCTESDQDESHASCPQTKKRRQR